MNPTNDEPNLPQDSEEFESIPLPPEKPLPNRVNDPALPESTPDSDPNPHSDASLPATTFTPEPAIDPEVKTEVKRQNPVLAWMGRHKVISTFLLLFLIGFITAAIVGNIFAAKYQAKTDAFDLADVRQVEDGSIALDRNGVRLGQVSLQDRRNLKLWEIPEHVVNALIATEDNRFYEHSGYDPIGIARAALANLKSGGFSQGGSTITQQLARHSFNLQGKTLDRKFTELFIALRIEDEYTKEEILESYLNRIYLGSGYWGIGAAAQGYYDKPVEELTVNEAATLAAIIKSPNRLSPFNDSAAAEQARNRTLVRMEDLGFITADEHTSLAQEPVKVVKLSTRQDRPHYLLASIRSEALKVLGQYRSLDGLTIETSIDRGLQELTGKAISRGLSTIESRDGYSHKTPADYKSGRKQAPDYLQAAVVVLENRTGQIVASVGGREFADSEFDRVRQGSRKPGAAVLPFLYGAGFSSPEFSPLTPVIDGPFDNQKVMVGGLEGVLGEWGAESEENPYEGEIPAIYALVKSKNGASVQFGSKVGLEKFKKTMSSTGISAPIKDYPNSFLGESPVNLLELTHAYTAFPNLGWKTKNSGVITRILTKDGELLYDRGKFPEQHMIFDEVTASQINEALSSTFQAGSARRSLNHLKGSVAGKTGTSYKSEDNWFIGYNSQYTWGVWVGFDKPKPIYVNAFSHDTALPIWESLSSSLDTGEPLATPSDIATRRICLLSGKEFRPHCHHTIHGDLTCQLPLPGNPESSEPGVDKFCPIHLAPGAPPVQENEKRTGEIKPDLFSGFRPIKPKVPAIIGEHPWTTATQ